MTGFLVHLIKLQKLKTKIIYNVAIDTIKANDLLIEAIWKGYIAKHVMLEAFFFMRFFIITHI